MNVDIVVLLISMQQMKMMMLQRTQNEEILRLGIGVLKTQTVLRKNVHRLVPANTTKNVRRKAMLTLWFLRRKKESA